MELSERFVGKYMRLARQVGTDNNPCHSRKIGVILVKVYENGDSRIVGTGYNGPPKKTPHCDSREYLEAIVWPQLTDAEKATACQAVGMVYSDWKAACREDFLQRAAGCGKCPRKLVGARSGERTELCSCEHAERNAIFNATEDLHGTWAFCWCGVACWDCGKAMINAGIRRAFFVDDGSYSRGGGPDYSFGTRWLFNQAGLTFSVKPADDYLE